MTRAAGGPLTDEEGHGDRGSPRHADVRPPQPGRRAPPCAPSSTTDAPNWFPARVNPFAGRLARRLCERTGYSNAYFGCSGSDAVEAAMKLARAATEAAALPRARGRVPRLHVGSTSLMTPGPFRDLFGPLVAGAETLPFGDIDALARALARDDVAASSSSRSRAKAACGPLPAPYVDRALRADRAPRRAAGRRRGADRPRPIGRTSSLSETWPRRPDVLLLAKDLGGGLLPVSAMLTTRALFERAYGANFQTGEAHNCTFSFNAVTAVAALATLDLLTDELFALVSREGARCFARRSPSGCTALPLLAEVRGVGLMLGVALRALDHPWLSFEHFGLRRARRAGPAAERRAAGLSPAIPARLFRLHLRSRLAVLRLQPRFEIAPESLLRFADLLRRETDYLLELT